MTQRSKVDACCQTEMISRPAERVGDATEPTAPEGLISHSMKKSDTVRLLESPERKEMYILQDAPAPEVDTPAVKVENGRDSKDSETEELWPDYKKPFDVPAPIMGLNSQVVITAAGSSEPAWYDRP